MLIAYIQILYQKLGLLLFSNPNRTSVMTKTYNQIYKLLSKLLPISLILKALNFCALL